MGNPAMSDIASANGIRVVTVAILALASCGGSSSPAGPSAAIPTSVAAVPAAVVEITTFRMTYWAFDMGVYAYLPEVTLTEKTGTSFARVHGLNFRMPDGLQYIIGDDCMLTEESRTVPAAGTWNMNSVYRYCRDLDSAGDISGLPVTLTVTYSDEHGVRGQLTSTSPAGQATMVWRPRPD
jgi:hypothetical protein